MEFRRVLFRSQGGDPFEEKRLIEACLQILDAGLVVGIQDLGAAGITGAASETSSKGGVGMDLHLSEVHVREEGMAPFEIMISESQERDRKSTRLNSSH